MTTTTWKLSELAKVDTVTLGDITQQKVDAIVNA